MICIGKD